MGSARHMVTTACLLMLAAGAAVADAAGVARSVVTTEVVDREPVDRLERVPIGLERVFYFTDLRGMEGSRVIHRWEYQGEMMAEVAFEVGGDRWRIWSSKRLIPRWRGEWRALLLDAGGEILAEERFHYGESEKVDASAGQHDRGGDK